MEPANDKPLEIQLKVRVFNPNTGLYSQVIGAIARISKVDAGLTVDPRDECIMICIDPGLLPNYADAKVLFSTHSRSFGVDPNSN